jgi:hypothetical protein
MASLYTVRLLEAESLGKEEGWYRLIQYRGDLLVSGDAFFEPV